MRDWKIIFKSLWIFVQVCFLGVLKVNNAFGWTWKKWMHGHTFRTTGKKSKSDIWAVPRYGMRSLRKIWDKRHLTLSHTAEVIYCQTTSQELQFSNYISAIKGKGNRLLIYRDDTPHALGVFCRLVLTVLVVVMGTFLFFCSLFAQHRSRLGLMLLQWVENILLFHRCALWSVEQIYFFGGYENDACFTGLMARIFNVHLITIPSANPIRNFYQQVVTGTFVITADFQHVEYDKYKFNWCCDSIQQWPFIEFSKLTPYIKGDGPTNSKSIGFLSRGAWLRKKRAVHAQNNNKDFEYEDRCMTALRQFLKLNPVYTLVVLPHPMECHRLELKQEAVAYYNDFFEGLNIEFYDKGLKSYECFADVNVTVTAISSANIERLYCGYKAMFAPLGAEMEFFSGSTLDNIVCRQEEKFDELLSDILSREEEDFFHHYELLPYRFDSVKIQR